MNARPGRLMLIEASALALAVRIGLRALSLPRLVRLLERMPRSRRRGQDPGRCLAAARVAVARVAHPTCLAESLVGYAMLRRRGHDAALHVGVSPRPVFGAHAWLTLDAEPVDPLPPGFSTLWQHKAR